ncbi:hypothetical protein HOY80DRAFT_1139715 [Tuber brumale]|nr:hypothetical protein HOY80DRAFT_1139715 [Tuber brumale]
MSSPGIYERIHLLDKINFHRHPLSRFPPHASPVASSIVERDLQSLNLISLLMVTNGPDDNAAVSLQITNDRPVHLRYTKTPPCTSKETSYINNLFALSIDDTYPPTAKPKALLLLALPACRRMIAKQMEKVCSQLKRLEEKERPLAEVLNPESEGTGSPQTTRCEEDIRTFVGPEVFPLDTTFLQFLKMWFHRLVSDWNVDKWFDSEAGFRLVYETINISYLLKYGGPTTASLDATLHQYLGNLGDYRAAVVILILEMKRWGVTQQSDLTVTEIPSPPPSTQAFSHNFNSILDQWANYRSFRTVGLNHLRKTYPEMSRLNKCQESAEDIFPACVHGECSLALSFAKSCCSTTAPTALRIGLPSPACWLCHKYLELIQQIYPHLSIHCYYSPLMRATGWTLPPETPSELIGVLNKYLANAMDEVLMRTTRMRKFHTSLERFAAFENCAPLIKTEDFRYHKAEAN